jgi:nucleoid DNA-binding protein
MHMDAGPLFDWQPGAVVHRDVKPSKVPKRPRPYQLEALEGGGMFIDQDGAAKPFPGVLAALEAHRSALLVLFTGGGKSFIAAQVAMRRPGRTLVLVHTDTLARQFRKELMDITGRPWQLEKAEARAVPEGGIDVVASVQTLAMPKRLERFSPEAFDTLVVDEAHHYTGEFFGRPIAYFRSAKVLLLTATPNRHDGVAMGTIADALAYRKDLAEAQAEAWSTPIHAEPLSATVDLSGVELDKFGEFKLSELDAAIARQIGPPCRAALLKCGDRRAIIFVPGVKAAQAGAEFLNSIRPDCARWVAGEPYMSPDLAEQVVSEHKRGRFQYVFNCNKLTEGYDDPTIADMIDAAPTASLLKTIQRVGRIARLGDPRIGDIEDVVARRAAIVSSAKPRAVWWVIEYSGSRITDLAGPADVLGGNFAPEVRRRAKRALAKKGGDVLVALEAAKAHEEMLRKRRAAIAAKAEVRLRDLGGVDPTKRRKRAPTPPKPNPNSVPPTEKQAGRLRIWDIPVPATLAEASKLITKEKIARDHGWCTYRQREKLARYGINGWAKSEATGRRLWAALQANGWKRLSDAQYAAALGKREPGSEG